MSSPYDRLIDDDALESINAYAELLLRQDDTTWHNVKTFGRLAETARDQLKKGGKVLVEGKLTTETWDDKQTGQKRSKTVIVALYLSAIPTARSSNPVPNQTPAADRERANQSTEITRGRHPVLKESLRKDERP